MRPTKLTVAKSDKIVLPNTFESSGTTLSIEFEVEPGEDLTSVLQRAKMQLDALYLPLLARDFQEYLNRIQLGTVEFLTQRLPQK